MSDKRRRGAVLVLTAVLLVVLLGITALAVDYGYLLLTRAELQSAADAAALAGAGRLLDDSLLSDQGSMSETIYHARTRAVQYAQLNAAAMQPVLIDRNDANAPDGDVVVGYLGDPSDLDEPMSFSDADQFNTVKVTVRRGTATGNPVTLFFAPLLGVATADLSASASATLHKGIKGFSAPAGGPNAMILPFAMSEESWNELIQFGGGSDSYAFDPETGSVSPGSDDIREVILYPLDLFDGGSGGGQNGEPCGNFGTVDIGNPDNSTADIARQIVYGINADDMSYVGGSIEFGPDGVLHLNGDTGISAGFKDELASIIGQTRSIPVFRSVSDPGNNADYEIVAFVGIRMLYVKLTGGPSQRRVVVQPAWVSDPTGIGDPTSEHSTFLVRPVLLSR